MKGRGGALVLACHEPTLDPRVHCTAESLAKGRPLVVVATVQRSEERPQENRPAASYDTIRIPYRRRPFFEMAHAFSMIWARRLFGSSILAAVLPPAVGFGVLAFGLGTLVVVVLGVALEVALLPFMLRSGQRPPLLSMILSITERLVGGASSRLWNRAGRPPADPGNRSEGLAKPERVTAGRLERPTKAIRITLSVLRFTFSVNTLLWRYIVERQWRPEIVYCHDIYTLQVGIMLKRACGARLIYDSHEYYPYQHQLWCFVPLMKLYESVLVREVDEYITVSPQLAAELSRVYGIEPVHAIPNVEPCPVPRPEARESEMSRLANGRLKLLYQGAFAEGRGLEEVISEWQAVDGDKVALFLRGPRNAWLSHLEGLADEMGLLRKSVYILPPVLERDLIAAAQEADVGLIPYKTDRLSYRFACPNKLSQYLHAGLAILTNRIGYVEQIVTDRDLGIRYDVGEEGSFARAVAYLSEDRRTVETFKKNALAFSEQVYNWGRFEHRLLSIVDGP